MKIAVYSLLLISLGFSFSAHALIIPTNNYNFPIQSNLISTLAGEVLPTCEVNYSSAVATVFDPLGKKRSLRFFISSENTNAKKALFIYSGLGSSEKSTLVKWFTCSANEAGYDVYVIRSTFSRHYARSGSFTHLPGEPVRDAVEVLQFTQSLMNMTQFKSKMYESVDAIGYSHGALLTAHMLVVAKKQGRQLFDMSLLVNPPLDLYYGTQVLDSMAAQNTFGLISSIEYLRDSRNLKKQNSRSFDSIHFYNSFKENINIEEERAAALIGRAFRQSVTKVVRQVLEYHRPSGFVSLPPRSSRNYRRAKAARHGQIGDIGFTDYLNRFLKVFIYKDNKYDISKINSLNSFYSLADDIQQMPNVRLITNSDDFLVKNVNEVQWLDNLLQDRSIIYPYGGHLGNVGYEDNQQELKSWFEHGLFRHEVNSNQDVMP